MITIQSVIDVLEDLAPSTYQESYDNAGLLTGKPADECTGIICTLDATEEVILEAAKQGCNMIVAHHPIIFSGLKKINGKNYIERAVIAAIKNDISIYAIHTNLDNILQGVNGKMADLLGLENRQVLLPKQNNLMKLLTFVPVDHMEEVREAIFKAGGGHIGKYSECSFVLPGKGSFKPEDGADPFVGEIGKRQEEDEVKMEIIFPSYRMKKIIAAMIEAHPYEEVAYDIISLANYFKDVGSGLLGELTEEADEKEFLQLVKEKFNLSVVRHTPLLNKKVKKVALCGGAGSFLINTAKSAIADVYITADVKYHEFFDADNQLLVADIGHWESEQFTIDLLHEVLQSNFTTFAVRKSEIKTNPVNYFI
ncbi:MAG TPA: Nif3-like dinuclear metal center hexameric protein [Segetibacter sp.]